MADSLRPVVKMLIQRLDITRGYLLPGYSEADQNAQAAIAFAESALAAEPPAPTPAIPLDLDALLSPEGAYEPGTGQEDDAQLVDQLQWWVPLHGCETLENLLDRIRRRILPHLRPPIAGIDVPGPDGDYGGLQELCDAEGVDVRIGAPLLKRAREAWGATKPPAPGPTIDDIWQLCEDHEFHLGMDGANEEESAEGLLEIINTALGRWGRPAPAEPVATLHVSDFRGYENYDFQHLVDLPPGHYKLFTACTAQPPAPASAADGEREELASALEVTGSYEIPSYEQLRRAAALLPPEGLEAIQYWAGDDGAVIQRTLRAPESWAIRAGSACMSTTGEWDIEPMPSERTDEWLANHRWPSAAAAWAALRQSRGGQEVGDE